jgi:ATP-dependent RNA helicase SUPV3L1/SUV3
MGRETWAQTLAGGGKLSKDPAHFPAPDPDERPTAHIVMDQGDTLSTSEGPAAAAGPSAYVVRGLQVIDAPETSEGGVPDALIPSDGLRVELEARVARFNQAVDASIVLANDGVIRWLGDPIGRLVAGPDILSPRTLVLADHRLTEAERGVVSERLETWLAATVRRLLGPLFALQDLEAETPPVRELADLLVKSLGVLERNPIRRRVRALDQDARTALRKHGVKFGAYYVYVPTTTKPAARTLALQMWALRAEVDFGPLAETLGAMASFGRTSVPLDGLAPRDAYRVAGFHPCGEQAVRVDIVERLADAIRAAMTVREPGALAAQRKEGFVVNSAMTSLTGCSGEKFNSILRSLGFESYETEAIEPPAPVAPEAAASPAEQSVAEGPAAEDHESPAGFLADESTPEGAGAPEPEGQEPPDQPEVAEPEAEQPEALELADGAPTPGEPPENEAEAAEAEHLKLALAQPEAIPEPEVALQPEIVAEPHGLATTQTAVREMIVMWRPARRPEPEKRPQRRSDAPAPPRHFPAQPQTADGGPPARDDRRSGPRWSGRPRDGAKSAPDARPAPESRPPRKGSDFRRDRQRPPEGDRPRPEAAPQRPNPAPKPSFADPNSPFAKLLELRSLLEQKGAPDRK